MESLFSRRALLRAGAIPLASPLLEAFQDTVPIGISDLLEGRGFVAISAGEFRMGSDVGNPDEKPVHTVRITNPFEMGKFEVTQEQWDGVMRDPHNRAGTPANPSHFKGTGLPVEYVSWEDVQIFFRRLNARDSKYLYRLPTEAEWEYACKAGRPDDKRSNPDEANPDEREWYQLNADNRTHRVGSKEPNAWGLYDMLGNVAEWVQDWYGREYYDESPRVDPHGPETGSYRVYRGGCWYDPVKNCRASYRGFDFPASQFYSVGFRVVRTPR